MKFSKEVDSEWTDRQPWQDLYQTMLIILEIYKANYNERHKGLYY